MLRLTIGQPAAPAYGADLVGAWDFARTCRAIAFATGPQPLEGWSIFPRAMKGLELGRHELDLARAGATGAIISHDDDLYDAGWQTDVSSGCRAIAQRPRRGLQDGDEVERIPFFVLPRAYGRRPIRVP